MKKKSFNYYCVELTMFLYSLLSAASLTEISEEQWRDLKLPVGLASKLKAKIQGIKGRNKQTPSAKSRPISLILLLYVMKGMGILCLIGSVWLIIRFYNFWGSLASCMLFLFGCMLFFRE
eukprot:TRINITY_DN1078_c0_g1_i1.p1 TRINITY_DN1078_c0_g1~~TRINITY_DN1078_c0_g1_i1.p1  ORF type:complete len:120 (-),score=6.26 TRINITY_DN1078_c0_g1_i1:171-530(-)